MRRRSLRTGLQLTELGLGVAQFGNLYREASDDEVAAAFNAAWDGGIRYFDTAPHYGLGLSERRIGALLREHRRDDYVLSTKVGRLLVPNPSGAGTQDTEGFSVAATLRREWDFSAGGIRRSIDESLERLGLDRIDIVYLHDPDDHWEQASREAVPALVKLRDEGVIGAFGAGMNQSAMLAEFVRRCDVDVVMLAGRYTLLEQRALADLMPAAVERGVRVVAAGVYNSGLLARDRPPADAHYNYESASADLIARARVIASVCERHGCTLPQAAIAFVLRHPAVVSAVVGAQTGVQAASNIDRYAAARIVPDALWEDLASQGLIAAVPLPTGES